MPDAIARAGAGPAAQLILELLPEPVLLVRGGRSDVLSREMAAEFLSLVPHAEFADVGDAHHMVAGDQNDAFATAVVEFLTRVTKAAR